MLICIDEMIGAGLSVHTFVPLELSIRPRHDAYAGDGLTGQTGDRTGNSRHI